MSTALAEALANGLTIGECAAVLGMCRSRAYVLANRAALIAGPLVIGDAQRREVLRLIHRSAMSCREIAKAVGVSKTSVLRIRDQAARIGAGRFARTRKSYRCPGCGATVQIAPCVLCAARGNPCQCAE
jgi:hypothetical protein